MKNNSRHSQLKNALIEQINKCTTNEKFPSERVLAERHQVCRATVNKVIVELQREGYLIRRQGKGTFVSPRDKMLMNCSDASFTQGDIIIAYPDFYSYLIWERVHYAELAALKNNFNLLNLKLQQESSLDILTKTIKKHQNLRGIILSPACKLAPAFLQKLDQTGIPIVLLGSITNTSKFKNIYEVRIDYFKAGYLKMNHILQNGHKRLGMVFNEPPSEASIEHLKGIKQALYDNDLRLKDLILSEKEMKIWDEPMKVGYEQTMKLFDKQSLTALVFETIRGAFGGVRALYEMGLKCPEDVSIIASQSSFGYEEMSCPSITTVNSNTEIAVNLAMDIIINNGSDCKNFINDTELFKRESVKNIK